MKILAPLKCWSILNPTQSNCSHFGASLPPRETMEDQLQRLVEKAKPLKQNGWNCWGKQIQMRQLLPRRLKLTRLTGMYSFLFLNLLLLGRPACFHLTHPITLAIPVQVSQEKRRAALTRKWRPLLWELNFKQISHVQFKNKKNVSVQVVKVIRKDPRKRR